MVFYPTGSYPLGKEPKKNMLFPSGCLKADYVLASFFGVWWDMCLFALLRFSDKKKPITRVSMEGSN